MDFAFQGIFILKLFIMAWLAILFLQSGLDKVFNYKGNKEWLTGHFSKSPLAGITGLMIPMITLLEVAAGILSLIGFFILLFTKEQQIAEWGLLLSALSLTCLFFGQRLAKDYAGAGGLVPYFLVVCVGYLIF